MRKQHFTQMGLSEANCLNLPHSDIWPYSASKFGGRNRRPKAENFRFQPKFLATKTSIVKTSERLSTSEILVLKSMNKMNPEKVKTNLVSLSFNDTLHEPYIR